MPRLTSSVTSRKRHNTRETLQSSHGKLDIHCYYDQPKCFVSSGNLREMIKQFVDYLVVVSQKSYVLLLDCFANVFEQINQWITNSEVYCTFDQLEIKICCDIIVIYPSRYLKQVKRKMRWKTWCNAYLD